MPYIRGKVLPEREEFSTAARRARMYRYARNMHTLFAARDSLLQTNAANQTLVRDIKKLKKDGKE